MDTIAVNIKTSTSNNDLLGNLKFYNNGIFGNGLQWNESFGLCCYCLGSNL